MTVDQQLAMTMARTKIQRKIDKLSDRLARLIEARDWLDNELRSGSQ
jgi:hypothetical protein